MSRSNIIIISTLCLASMAMSCSSQTESTGLEDAQARLEASEIAATVLAAMDTTADPCQDFYRYACGGWLDDTELPSDQSRWTRSFSVIGERNREVVRDILEQAAANPEGDADRQRIGHFYGSCMNEKAVEEAGAKPLQPLFTEIANIKDVESLLAVTGKLHRHAVGAFFGVGAFPDFKNPDMNIAFFFQGGLGMPDRDYYISDDPQKQELLLQYEAHVTRMFVLLDENERYAATHAEEVIAFETELARVSRDRAELRVMERLYNPIGITGLQELTPGLPWNAYLEATGHPDVKDVSVATPEFFEALDSLIAASSIEVLQSYLRWHVLNDSAALLSSTFVDTDFEFYGQQVAGQSEIKPRWKRCVDATQGALGESVGKLYVQRMFAGSSKDVALEMIGDLESAFSAGLPGLAWMDETTRGRAQEKVAALGHKIGYPDEWRDYSSIAIVPGDFFGNTMAAIAFDFDREANKIGKPVDRNEWGMTPQMVNAYNNPLMNEIVFPAGILQPPFFHRDFPAAMNYGGIGGVIGHELTHGYDDQGRKFDPQGRMEEWWAPEVAAKFEKQAWCVDEFYSGFEVEPGVAVNGRLTLGENIADIGGLKQAHRAYKLWEERHGSPDPFVEGLTNEQLLFVSWGQVWCTEMSPEVARLLVTTDEHSPPPFRVRGPVAHIPAFSEAFQCEPGTPMRPEEQCVVW